MFDYQDYQAMSNRVEETTAYKVEFVEKPLSPMDEDDNLWPALNNFNVRRKKITSSIEFRNIASLAARLNKSPQENNVTVFCSGVLEEMNTVRHLL